MSLRVPRDVSTTDPPVQIHWVTADGSVESGNNEPDFFLDPVLDPRKRTEHRPPYHCLIAGSSKRVTKIGAQFQRISPREWVQLRLHPDRHSAKPMPGIRADGDRVSLTLVNVRPISTCAIATPNRSQPPTRPAKGSLPATCPVVRKQNSRLS